MFDKRIAVKNPKIEIQMMILLFILRTSLPVLIMHSVQAFYKKKAPQVKPVALMLCSLY